MNILKFMNIALACIITVATMPGTALSSGLVVLYPQVRQPYAKIYEDILAGIEETNQSNTHAIAVNPNQSIDYYRNSMAEIEPDAVIALGEKNVTLAQDMDLSVSLVAGGITSFSESVTGISMIPDSRVIIDKLLLLYGNVRNIHTVTNNKNREDQLTAANDYATSKGINLVVHNVSTLQAAASEYRTLLAKVEEHDAIWLIRDKALNDSALLSQILETAWQKKVAVFSSNPTHVKRGALFAIYPNNRKLGASLAHLAANTNSKTTEPSSLSPLRDVYTIVNGRTSRHLGVSIDQDVRAGIDSIL